MATFRESFTGLCDLMEMRRPDLLIFENVDDIDKPKEDAGSDLDILKNKWASLGYELQVCYCDSHRFGVPQSRERIYIVAINAFDPKTFTLVDRSINQVFSTFSSLLKVCHRKASCASTFY